MFIIHNLNNYKLIQLFLPIIENNIRYLNLAIINKNNKIINLLLKKCNPTITTIYLSIKYYPQYYNLIINSYIFNNITNKKHLLKIINKFQLKDINFLFKLLLQICDSNTLKIFYLMFKHKDFEKIRYLNCDIYEYCFIMGQLKLLDFLILMKFPSKNDKIIDIFYKKLIKSIFI